jgi:putative ABC transport system permease protein
MKFTVKRLEARLHLDDLIAMTGDRADPQASESVGAINVALTNPADAEKFASDVASRTTGLTVRPTTRTAEGGDPFAVLDRFHLAIAIITMIGSTAFLLALMVMRAAERRETVGILRLIGFARRSILIEVLLEGVLVATAGAIFGIILSVGVQDLVNRVFQWRYDTTLIFVRVTPSIALRSGLFAVPLGVFAGLAASWALLRREIVALLRR